MARFIDGLRAKAVTILDPFGGFRTVGPFDFARDHAPIETMTLGQLYEQSAPAQAGVRTLASGVSQCRFKVALDGDEIGKARPVGDRRLERALNDPKLIVACVTDLSVWGNAVAVMIGDEFVHVPWPAVMVTGSGLLPTGYTINSQTYRPDEVLHFRHPRATFGDLLTGAAPLEACRSVLEEDLAAFRAAAADARGANRYIKRGLDAPKWSDTARLRFERRIAGLFKDRSAPPVLEEGMDVTAVPQTVDAAWTPARRLAYDAVCSVLGIPPAMVAAADSDRNQDASQRSFMVDGVRPVAAIIAQEATVKAVPAFYGDNRFVGRIIVTVDTSDYGRDRFAERARAYALAIGTAEAPGWLDPDEVRLIEGLEPR
jgi:phage portal protein BeeE